MIRAESVIGRPTPWRQRDNKPARSGKSYPDLTDEQKQIRHLQKQLKEAQLEREILKKRSASFPGATIRRTVADIPIYKGARQPGCRTLRHGLSRYIQTGEGWLYLTAILDLANRKVAGWASSDSLKAIDTSIAAWQMALKNRPLAGELLFHCAGNPV